MEELAEHWNLPEHKRSGEQRQGGADERLEEQLLARWVKDRLLGGEGKGGG